MRIAQRGISLGTNVPRESKRLHLVLRNQAPRRSRQHVAHHTTIFPRLGSHFTGNEPLRRKYRPDEPITDRQNRRAASPAQSLAAQCKISLNEEPQAMKGSYCNAFPIHHLLFMFMERSEDQTKLRPNFVENFRGGRALRDHEKKLLSADR